MNATAYKTTLRQIFTPALDRSTGGKFTMNHTAYMVSFFRNGDSVTVNHYGEKGWAPCRPLLDSTTHSIRGLLAGLRETAQDCGVGFECEDDLPEGWSMADPAALQG